MDQHLKHLVDGAALVASFGSFAGWLMGWLPLALTMTASIMSIIWLGMQMRDRAERKRQEAIVSQAANPARTIEMGDA